jgi:hypothetical protein
MSPIKQFRRRVDLTGDRKCRAMLAPTGAQDFKPDWLGERADGFGEVARPRIEAETRCLQA